MRRSGWFDVAYQHATRALAGGVTRWWDGGVGSSPGQARAGRPPRYAWAGGAAPSYGSSPSSWARMTAWVRLAAPSLSRMWGTWRLTVSRVITSAWAIAGLDLPAAS